MQCRNCSSGDFERLSDRAYKCRYCGTIQILEVESQQTGHGAQSAPAWEKNRRVAAVIGAGADYVHTDRIVPGDYGLFTVRIIPVNGIPDSFQLDYDAAEVR